MKYAVLTPADQTIIYVTLDGSCTTVHSEAELFDSVETATKHINKYYPKASVGSCKPDGDGLTDFLIEPVIDEAEFVSREDTW